VSVRDLLADFPDTRTGERVVYYDAGMLIALLGKDLRARTAHEALTASPHRPVITGPVLAQVWRDGPAIVHALAGIADDCTILQAKDDIGPIRGLERGVIDCLPCHRVYRRADFQRAGKLLGKADLAARSRSCPLALLRTRLAEVAALPSGSGARAWTAASGTSPAARTWA
jgi:hypothetical protein